MSFFPSQLYGEPFISTRESIAWIPSTPAFEDSDVLILSSRSTSAKEVDATLFYLDLRLSLPLGRSSKVNWGFAGLRTTLSTSPVRHRWTHSTIDSRDDGAVDEGEMTQREGLEIETGVGLNPATGQIESYEEIWRDEPLPAGSPYVFASLSADVEKATATMAVLGPHALALAQEPGSPDAPREFQAVRMRRRASGTVADTQEIVWEIVFSTGNLSQERELEELVGLADRECQYARGDNVYLGGRHWVIWDVGRKGTAARQES